jgi:hypothetical protein
MTRNTRLMVIVAFLLIAGTIPGDVQFAVSIGYLRKRFPDPGDCILLTLHGCTSISCRLWDSESVITDLASIAAAEPEILSADGPTTVFCVNGDGSLSSSSDRDGILECDNAPEHIKKRLEDLIPQVTVLRFAAPQLLFILPRLGF